MQVRNGDTGFGEHRGPPVHSSPARRPDRADRHRQVRCDLPGAATGSHPGLLPAVNAAFDELVARGLGAFDIAVTRRFISQR